MKFGICNEIFNNWKIEDTIEYVGRLGYNALEVAPFTLAKSVTDISDGERKKIRTDAARAGIAISGIHWVLVEAEGMYMNHPDAEVRNRTSRYFCDLVDFCADLDGRSIIVGSPKQRQIMDGVSYEQAWEWAQETFRSSLGRARDKGVEICLEPLAPSETNFINTAAEAIRFVKEANSPAFKIILDVKAMCSEDKSIPDIIRDSWPHFGYFHANDRNLKGPGFGDVDFAPIAAALKEVGYEGYVSVEVFNFEEGPEVIATRSLEYLKKTFS